MITYNEGLYDSDKNYEGGIIWVETLSDTLELAETKKTSFARELSESISFGDIIRRSLNKSVDEMLSFSEGLGKSIKRSFIETLLLEERLTRKLNGVTIIWEKITQATSALWKKIYNSGYYDSLELYDQEKSYDGVSVYNKITKTATTWTKIDKSSEAVYNKIPKATTIWNKINKP